MNRIEALQAAFNIAGPNVTAEEHIQYAEFLLGDQNTIVLENRITRDYTPHDFIGEYVDTAFDDDYPVGAVARDDDVWVKTEDGWEMYYAANGQLSEYWNGIEKASRLQSVFVA